MGCNAARVFIASPSDYGDYRRIRLARGLDDRIAAAAVYLERHPDGRYASRVARYLGRAEPVYFKVRRRSAKGLSAYMRSLPRGANHEQAVAELVRARRRKRSETLSDQLARETQMRLDSESDARRRAASLLARWLALLLDARNWHVPLSQARAELLVPYRIGLPQPVCRPDGQGWICVKTLRRGYPIAHRGERVRRVIRIELELRLDSRWRLRQARLAGEAIFERMAEAKNNRLSRDPAAITAADRERASVALFRDVGARLEKQAAHCGSSATLERSGGGWRCGELRVRRTVAPDRQDVIVIAGSQ
jgi:hypothetical protein